MVAQLFDLFRKLATALSESVCHEIKKAKNNVVNHLQKL